MGNNVGSLNDVITELETQTEDIKNFSNVLKKIDIISQNATSLDMKINENVQRYISISETMKKSAELLDSRLDALETMIKQNIHELYKDNQNYQKELDDSIHIRLEKFKIDVELNMKSQISDIENKIVDAIKLKTGTLNKNISEIDKKLNIVLKTIEKDRGRGFWARILNR